MARLISTAVTLLCLPILSSSVSALEVQSQVDTLKFSIPNKLPMPSGADDRTNCNWLGETPATGAGQELAQLGWRVLSEVSLGEYQAIAFAEEFQQGTSGTCIVQNGQVGIFEGDSIVALLSGESKPHIAIAILTSLEDGGVRVWSGDLVGEPVGDIRVSQDLAHLTLRKVAAEESVCGERAWVPNVYGMRINEARDLLLTQGWQPEVQPINAESSFESSLHDRGLPEVRYCSGTGLNYCGFGYVGASALLEISTVGESDYPVVAGYEVNCSRSTGQPDVREELENVRLFFVDQGGKQLLEAQALLAVSGHYTQQADGKWGPATAKAFSNLLATYIAIGGSGDDWGVNEPADTVRFLDWAAEAAFATANGTEFPD